MKSLLYSILIFVTTFNMYSQDDDMRDGRHYFKRPIPEGIPRCDANGNILSAPAGVAAAIVAKTPPIVVPAVTPASPTTVDIQAKAAVALGLTDIMTIPIEENWEFTIVRVMSDYYIIQIPKFTDDSDQSKNQNILTWEEPNTNQTIYFKLNKELYNDCCKRAPRKWGFVVAASTTLIKIRPGNNKEGEEKISSEFGNDFNIGATAGLRLIPWKDKDISLSLMGGLSFSSIKVTPESTRNYITAESSQACITFNGGIVLEIEKFQISCFTGIDCMSGEIGEHWIYRNRPWLGIGFGYQIFSQKGKASN